MITKALSFRGKKRKIAFFFLTIFLYELIQPASTFALTSGPTQPEFQGFTPIGATDMVDMFTGNFTYNIPLMDVDGYPLNMSYHNISNADEESSWVGLGWNLNVGEVQHNVNGLPDDFSGDFIDKFMHVKWDEDWRIGLKVNLELFGFKIDKAAEKLKNAMSKKNKGKLSFGIYYGQNSYYGQYGGFSTGFDMQIAGEHAGLNPSINMDFSSNNGADMGVSVNYSYAAENQKKLSHGYGIGTSFGYNTRHGYKDFVISGSYSLGIGDKKTIKREGQEDTTVNAGGTVKYNGTIPITLGLINYVPVMTNESKTSAWSLGASFPGIKIIAGLYGTISGSFYHSTTHTKSSAGNKGYGYLYMGNSSTEDMLDFTRDQGGTFNKKMPNLPMANMTYDGFSVNAQGAGGEVRAFRNDIGVIHDPKRIDDNNTENYGLALEFGIGTIGEFGTDIDYTNVKYEAGPIPDGQKHKFKTNNEIYNNKFSSQAYSGMYEPYYLKSKGEISSMGSFFNNVGGHEIYPNDGGLTGRSIGEREPRQSMTYFYKTSQVTDTLNDVGFIKTIDNYTDTTGLKNGMNTAKVKMLKNSNNRQPHHISEVTHINANGDRYVFGIPAMNNISREVTMAIDNSIGVNNNTGLCTVPNIANANVGGGRDELYTYTVTPAYAHSYLLSAILPSNYSDIKNDGITPDDIGNYFKFNYSLKDNDYRWRMPYPNSGNTNNAYYESGYRVDQKDNRASFSSGSKELWYVHSIESKNMVAEFYTSPKQDGKGATEEIYNTSYASTDASNNTYKLDSIKLFNRNDRFKNGQSAVPIKTVYFEYDYSLCKNTPNSTASGSGKLTLKRIYFKYGNSDKSLLSPYQFQYSSFNPDYNPATKNRWGTYQPIKPLIPNFLFPYVDQFIVKDSADQYASAWQLEKIKLPSGGEIKVSYESDDYAFVQDKRACEMTNVLGVGSNVNYSSKTTELYTDVKNTNDYIFVRKRGNSFFSTEYKKVFLDNADIMYFNFAVDVCGKNMPYYDNYDQVKGFAEVENIVECPDDSTVLAIKIKKRELEKSKLEINPITHAGINMARRDLSHQLYPGADNPSFGQMFVGIWAGLKEFINSIIMVNPVKSMVKKNKARNFDPFRSFVRLTTPNLKKRGGGCRVRRVELNDNWDKLMGGEPNSSYGMEYQYTTNDPTYGEISSGVASYEPTVGGDENPLRGIQHYKIMNGSGFPRNEPIHETQFTPLGEQFYPSPVVGYSKVITKSIHEPYAYSAQAYAQHEFYTARDFPVQYKESKLDFNKDWRPYIVRNENSWYGWQSYVLLLNDMHGKARKISNFAKRSPGMTAGKDLVTSVEYQYNSAGNKLQNEVKTLRYNTNNSQFEVANRTMGEEIDVTIDSRYSRQRTFTAGISINLHIETPPYIIIPTVIPNVRWDIKKFGSHVVTKIVQQYGLIQSTITTTDKAVNIERNEIYDPETGQVLVKSYNNEFKDKMYSSYMPASWAYRGMSATYKNLFYTDTFSKVTIDACKRGRAVLSTDQTKILCPGDELIMYLPSLPPFKVWVDDFEREETPGSGPGSNGVPTSNFQCVAPLIPRIPLNSPWPANTTYTSGVHFEVIRSGRKNQLSSNIQQSVSMASPVGSGNSFTPTPSQLISLGTTTFDNRNVLINGDTCNINPYVVGWKGNYRQSNSYVYYKDRTYATPNHSRTDGLFNINSGDNFWSPSSANCIDILSPNPSSNWKKSSHSVWFLPNGTEVENVNALMIPSSAQFGFDNQQPLAIANNTNHNTFFYDGFEDYKFMQSMNSTSNPFYYPVFNFHMSPFKQSPLSTFTNVSPTAQSPYQEQIPASGSNWSINSTSAHTGNYCMQSSGNITISIPVSNGVMPFVNRVKFLQNNKYILSMWVNGSPGANTLTVTASGVTHVLKPTTNKIDGWVKYEAIFPIPTTANVVIQIPPSLLVDDIRAFPTKANMKSFVYNDTRNRLMAILDENNFASFYEYNIEGTLLRTKKETEKGILTIQENRSSNKKTN